MSRSRFSSEDVFLSEVDRLQKERSRLLKERNPDFAKHPQDNKYSQSGIFSKDQYIDNRQHFSQSRRSPKHLASSGPNIQEVKMMLEDIMKNSQRHGMNKSLSLQYLKDIQRKLTREIQQFNIHMRRSVESDKLRSLKVFVDRLVSAYEPQFIHAKEDQNYSEVKQGMKKVLENIPEAAYPSISSMQQSIASYTSSSNQISSSQQKSSSEIQSSQQLSSSIINRDITLKKISSNQASGLLDILENKIFDEVSYLRKENLKLKKQIQQLRDDGSYTRGKRRDSINQNQTLINQLVRTDPKNYEAENYRLKNKIRSLEMEILSFRSLKNIQLGRGESRMHVSLEGKDNEIKYLRKQIQDLITHLQNSKQEINYLHQQVSDLTSKLSYKADFQQKLINNIKTLQAELYRIKGGSSRIKPNYQPYPRNTQNQFQSQSKRKGSDFKKKVFVDRQNSQFGMNKDVGKNTHDKFGEYKEVLFTLRSLRK